MLWEFCTWTIALSADRDSCIFKFFILLAKTFTVMLNRSSGSWRPCLAPGLLGGNIQFFHHNNVCFGHLKYIVLVY